MNRKIQASLRAALKNEDAALERRLPQAAAVTARPGPRKTSAATAGDKAPPARAAATAKPVTRKAAPAAKKAASAKRAAKPAATRPATPKSASATADARPAKTRTAAVKQKSPATRAPAGTPAVAKPATTPRKAVAAKKNATPSAELPPAPEVVAAAAKRPKSSSPKPEKRVRDTFTLVGSDVDRLKTLKGALATGGRKCSRSELLRAGLKLLASQDATTISVLLDQLPAVRKGKRK